MNLSLLSWNILSGGFKDYKSTALRPERLEGISQAIKSLNPDIVSLVDTHRWTEVFSAKEIENIFAYLSVHMVKLYDHRLIDLDHDNGITVMSKRKDSTFSNIRLVNRNAIKTHINGLDIFSIYLDDLSEDVRLTQLRSVLSLVDPMTPTIIMGDFNTFDKQDLPTAINDLNNLSAKYPAAMQSMKETLDGMKRCEATELLKQSGFSDLGSSHGNTVPAKLFPLKVEQPIIRLDYAFGNHLVKLNNFKVLLDSPFADLSDHYPIYLNISIKKE